jgi:hypothetical protein
LRLISDWSALRHQSAGGNQDDQADQTKDNHKDYLAADG